MAWNDMKDLKSKTKRKFFIYKVHVYEMGGVCFMYTLICCSLDMPSVVRAMYVCTCMVYLQPQHE